MDNLSSGALLTPQQVATRLGLAQQTLANWRSTGKGPAFVKLGRLVRYREDKLKAWLKAALTV